MPVVFYDGQKGPEIRENLNNLVVIFEEAIASATGPKGWSPVLITVEDGTRVVLELSDWIGGEGTKPTTLGYLSSTGIVSDISEALNIKGADGKEVELRNNSTHIQWRYVGGTWADLVALADLKGQDGKEVELQVTSTHIQWRYVGDVSWTNLIALSELKGATGPAAWNPVYGNVADGIRIVQQVQDWVGGEGTKPAIGKYLGLTGYVDAIGDATDIRGPSGSGSGDVTGPSSSTANAVALFDGTSGKVIKAGGVLATVATSGSYDDLSSKPTIPAAQVQTDWNAGSGISSIANKPAVIAAGNTQADARAAIGAGTGNSNLVIGTTAGTALEGNTAFKTINGNSIKGTGDITISGSTYETGDYRESYANTLSGYIKLPASNDIQIVAQNSYPALTSALPTSVYTKGTAILKRTASTVSTTNNIATASDNAGNWVHCISSTQVVYSTDNGNTWSTAVTTGATTRTADAAGLNTPVVFWAGDRFVIVPASGMVMYYAFPASLSTWTAMTTAGLPGNINSALWDGTNIIVSSQSNTTTIAYSSNGGTSWTSQATGLSSSKQILIGRPGLLLAISANTFASRYSTNSGVSWSASSVTIPGSVTLGNLVGDRYWSYNSTGRIGILVTAASTAEFIYTDNGSSFSSVTLPVNLQGGTTAAMVNNTTNTWFAIRSSTYTYSTDNGLSWATAANTGSGFGYVAYMDGVFYAATSGNPGVFCADIANGMFGPSGGTTTTNFPAPLFSGVVQNLFGTFRVVAAGSVLLVISNTNIYSVKSTDVFKKALAIPYKTPSVVTGDVTLNVFIKT